MSIRPRRPPVCGRRLVIWPGSHWVSELPGSGNPARFWAGGSAEAILTAGKGGWGMGVPVSGSGASLSFGHGGNSPGYATFWILYPATGDGVVVMADAWSSGALIMEIVRAMERVYGWPGDYAPERTGPSKPGCCKACCGLGSLRS